VVLSSGVWTEKVQNQFQSADMAFLNQVYDEDIPNQKQMVIDYIKHGKALPLFNGELEVLDGKMTNQISLVVSRSLAEDFMFYNNKQPFSGRITVVNGKWQPESPAMYIEGKSLIHSAPLTTVAFSRSILGEWGKYIVSIGILLFAFSTAISWSYYGDRAITFLVGPKYVIFYRIFYVVAFFIASFTDTTIIWSLSYITIAFMTVPNLIGLWILRKEIKSTIAQYWIDFSAKYPEDRMTKKYLKRGKL
jgi:AGCS family alanine or glycine:cation symporter